MSKLPPTLKGNFKSFLKTWGVKITEWLVVGLVYFGIYLFRILLATVVLLIFTPMMWFAIILLGSRRSSQYVDSLSRLFKNISL